MTGLRSAVDASYRDRLTRLAIGDTFPADALRFTDAGPRLDHKCLMLARFAALVAVGGVTSSYGAHIDAAVSAGATADDIVDLLVGVCDVVGTPRVVSAAPHVALALGLDLDEPGLGL